MLSYKDKHYATLYHLSPEWVQKSGVAWSDYSTFREMVLDNKRELPGDDVHPAFVSGHLVECYMSAYREICLYENLSEVSDETPEESIAETAKVYDQFMIGALTLWQGLHAPNERSGEGQVLRLARRQNKRGEIVLQQRISYFYPPHVIRLPGEPNYVSKWQNTKTFIIDYRKQEQEYNYAFDAALVGISW